MSGRRDSWRETIRSVGDAMIGVLRAELALISETWQRSGKELGKVAGVMILVAYLAFVLFPTLLMFAIMSALHSGLGWPLWGAALAVAGLVVLAVVLFLALAKHMMKSRFENPVTTVRHRISDHRAWWNERIVPEANRGGEADEALDQVDRTAAE